jgi:saccharopine dehydrogenase-like NADP-dependent oxidoreductase
MSLTQSKHWNQSTPSTGNGLIGRIKEAGIVVMNEIGLDPGIDHLYAIKTIDEVHAKGGKILSFVSFCGGLPAPEASNNPLGYKFSWSSRGVLLALRNNARYYKDGKVRTALLSRIDCRLLRLRERNL